MMIYLIKLLTLLLTSNMQKWYGVGIFAEQSSYFWRGMSSVTNVVGGGLNSLGAFSNLVL